MTTLGACVGAGERSAWPTLASLWPVTPAISAASDPVETGTRAARSIWGVVPSAPRRKADLRPELIRGSAMAVSADTLLASCQAVEGRPRVGLVRHNKYRIARVTPDAAGQICRLTVAEGPLTPAAGYRSFADLRVGEPVVALASRTSAEVAAAPGWLAGKGSSDDPFLEATPTVPAGNRSAVLVDGFGNLIGLGAAAPVAGGLVLAVPVGPAATADLANRDLGEADVLLAALTPSPRAQPRQPAVLLAVGNDDRDSTDRAPATRRAALTAGDGAGAPAPSGGPARGLGGGAAAGGAPVGGSGPGTTGSVDGVSTGGSTAGGGAVTGTSPATDGAGEAPSTGPVGNPVAGGGAGGTVGGPGRDVAADDDGGGRGRGGSNRGRGGGGRGDGGDDDDDGDSRGRGNGGRGGGGRGDGGDDDDDGTRAAGQRGAEWTPRQWTRSRRRRRRR